MNKRKTAVITLIIVAIAVIAIAGTLVYYNSLGNTKSSTPTLTSAGMPTATPANTPFENLTFTSFKGGFVNDNWNMTFTLQNTGNITATISDIIIDGQSYMDITPAPTINPSIINGYTLPVNQTLTITIQGTSANPYHNGGKLCCDHIRQQLHILSKQQPITYFKRQQTQHEALCAKP